MEIEAFDDEGMSYGPLTLTIDAGRDGALQLERPGGRQREQGPDREARVPARATGVWMFSSALDIEALSYIRTTGRVPDGDARHRSRKRRVATRRRSSTPAATKNQESLLRLVNPGDEAKRR